MEHTPTPWDNQHKYLDTDLALMSKIDYERAKACVNACEGMEDPAKWLENVSQRIDKLTKDTVFVLEAKDKEIQALRDRIKELEAQVDNAPTYAEYVRNKAIEDKLNK